MLLASRSWSADRAVMISPRPFRLVAIAIEQPEDQPDHFARVVELGAVAWGRQNAEFTTRNQLVQPPTGVHGDDPVARTVHDQRRTRNTYVAVPALRLVGVLEGVAPVC